MRTRADLYARFEDMQISGCKRLGCNIDKVQGTVGSLKHSVIIDTWRSRSGEPAWGSVTSSPNPPPWSSSVSWEKADILKPSTYKPLLKDADAVIHTMGILLEADYKGVLQGKESILSGLQRAFSATKAGSQNPLERKEGEDLRPQEKDGQLTYELMNRDTGVNRIMRYHDIADAKPA